jgi:hypothetical protein
MIYRPLKPAGASLGFVSRVVLIGDAVPRYHAPHRQALHCSIRRCGGG